MSGVSGGALGVSVHMVQLEQNPPVSRFLAPAEGMLGDDHIAPVLAFTLFPDLLQRFLIAPFGSFDRARALESSWEVSARRHLGGRAFSAPFLDLWRDKRRALPALLLASTRAETGQRVIISSLPISRDFVDAVDLLRPQPASTRQSMDGITLAAAVHLSARFAYISPGARVATRDGGLWGRLVDGGYFESSGASTVDDLLHAICPDWNKTGSETRAGQRPVSTIVCSRTLPPSFRRVVPIVLLIKNDPQAPSLCDEVPQSEGSGVFFTELKLPFDALLNTKDARARIAQRALVREVEGHDLPSGDCEEGCVLELSLSPRGTSEAVRAAALSHNQYNDPPLGWSLSQSSRAAMDHRFDDPDIQGQLECIANLAHGKACTTAQRCVRPAAPPNPAGETRSEPAVASVPRSR